MTIPKITAAEFLLSVHQPGQLPPGDRPEVAFLGRSNVGKSSLINCLLGRRNLVRTSNRPGCTQALNFFLINNRWYFVDLPGFGYAAVSKGLKAAWGRLVMAYLSTRKNLTAVVLLQDGRRVPGPEELFLWEFFREHGLPVIPVLTKVDKLKQGERAKQLKNIVVALASLGVKWEEFLWFSAVTHEGRDKVWTRLLQCRGGA
jgi:GTP-binding protein